MQYQLKLQRDAISIKITILIILIQFNNCILNAIVIEVIVNYNFVEEFILSSHIYKILCT